MKKSCTMCIAVNMCNFSRDSSNKNWIKKRIVFDTSQLCNVFNCNWLFVKEHQCKYCMYIISITFINAQVLAYICSCSAFTGSMSIICLFVFVLIPKLECYAWVCKDTISMRRSMWFLMVITRWGKCIFRASGDYATVMCMIFNV